MSKSSDRWKRFWENQTLPLHAQDNADFYLAYGREISLLFGEKAFERVLDIGCGNGALFEPLGFDQASTYCGVDLSETMLAEFGKQYSGLELQAHPGQTYQDGQQYDLIFSSGVIQYFTPAMLEEHFRNATHMLASGGRLVCAAIPWKITRFSYYCGQLTQAQRPGLLRFSKSFVRRLFDDHMGRWYHHTQIERVAHRCGFNVRFHGSNHYPYRFHAVLERAEVQAATESHRRAA